MVSNFINRNIEKLSQIQTKIRIEQFYFEYIIFMPNSPHAKRGSHPSSMVLESL